jgi:Immunity protein 26
MMARLQSRFRLGDVFSVDLDNSRIGYFQYIADDPTQLSSNVIRVFSEKFETKKLFELETIVGGDVQFFAHVFLKAGVKFSSWKRVGNSPVIQGLQTLFRDSADYGNPAVKSSNRWYIWKIGEPQRYVGPLSPEFQSAEIGVVIAPEEIGVRMKTGSYSYQYPDY